MIERNYDFLKNAAQVWLPGLATLYFTLSQIWGIPFGPQVVGSIAALDAFLGLLLKISTSKYTPAADGTVFIDQTDPEKEKYKFDFKVPLEEISGKDQIIFNVAAASNLGESQGKHAL